MLITKEKVTTLVAILIALLAGWSTLSGYELPGAVEAPAEAEGAQRYNPDGELLPELQASKVWQPGSSRDPFEEPESYSETAPVPLSLPPSLEPPAVLPGLNVGRRFDGGDMVTLSKPDEDPEPGVEEVSDALGG